MSLPIRMKVTEAMVDFADCLAEVTNPHLYIWLIKAQSSLTSAAFFICTWEVQGCTHHATEFARRCLEDALKYAGEAFNRGAPPEAMAKRMRQMRECLATLPQPYTDRRSSAEGQSP